MGDVPHELVPYKYVVFSWRITPIFKKDPLARAFFDKHVGQKNLSSLLGLPLNLWLSQTNASKAPELFLSRAQAIVLQSQLAVSMGNTRVASSWKADAYIKADQLVGGVQTCTFATMDDVEAKLSELRRKDNELATEGLALELEWMRKLFHGAVNGVQPFAAFVALDVETWEMDHLVLTEFGLSSLRTDGGRVSRDSQHFGEFNPSGVDGRKSLTERCSSTAVISENSHRRNGRYCPDARDHFDFGTTTTLPEYGLLSTLQQLFSSLSSAFPLFLVMHDPRSDIQALELLGIDPTPFHRDLSAFDPKKKKKKPTSGIWVLDTQKLYSGWGREKQQTKLATCCQVLNVPTRRLHNAGNDAVYTLEVFERLMNPQLPPPPPAGI